MAEDSREHQKQIAELLKQNSVLMEKLLGKEK